MSLPKKDKVVALKRLEKEFKANQKACQSAWPDGSPFYSICMQKAAAVFESELEQVLSSKQ
ncbi:MAG: hypothetical protein OQL20_00375 [Sedimenticola sp.]|nr:hypothetical protein [Sedimenticola sp.]